MKTIWYDGPEQNGVEVNGTVWEWRVAKSVADEEAAALLAVPGFKLVDHPKTERED